MFAASSSSSNTVSIHVLLAYLDGLSAVLLRIIDFATLSHDLAPSIWPSPYVLGPSNREVASLYTPITWQSLLASRLAVE